MRHDFGTVWMAVLVSHLCVMMMSHLSHLWVLRMLRWFHLWVLCINEIPSVWSVSDLHKWDTTWHRMMGCSNYHPSHLWVSRMCLIGLIYEWFAQMRSHRSYLWAICTDETRLGTVWWAVVIWLMLSNNNVNYNSAYYFWQWYSHLSHLWVIWMSYWSHLWVMFQVR